MIAKAVPINPLSAGDSVPLHIFSAARLLAIGWSVSPDALADEKTAHSALRVLLAAGLLRPAGAGATAAVSAATGKAASVALASVDILAQRLACVADAATIRACAAEASIPLHDYLAAAM
jgi:hypothetical protein